MNRLLRPSWKPAAIVGILMLLAAGGGYAIAPGVNTVNACIEKRSHVLYVGKCRTGDTQISWNKVGPRGPRGLRGAPGTARAYAYVNADATTPSFDAARTKGFTALSEPYAGIYCLTPASTIDLSRTAVAVTPVWNSGVINNSFAQLRGSDCSSSQLEVFTYYDGGSGIPVASHAIDFTVVVP